MRAPMGAAGEVLLRLLHYCQICVLGYGRAGFALPLCVLAGTHAAHAQHHDHLCAAAPLLRVHYYYCVGAAFVLGAAFGSPGGATLVSPILRFFPYTGRVPVLAAS